MKTSGFTNYIYLLYGQSDVCFAEAAYSIGTLLEKTDARFSRVIVFTDRPEKIGSWPVVCESIADHFEKMKGQIGYWHRAKLCVISRCFELYPGNVIFFDSDTIIHGPIRKFADSLVQGKALMHRFESKNPIAGLAGFRTRLPDGTFYCYGGDSWMYNSGVIGIHESKKDVIPVALAICDELLATGMKSHTFEQIAISEALRISNIEILEVHPAVSHYCRNSQKKYMREKIPQACQKLQTEPWKLGNTIPYSYPRVFLSKILRKLGA